MKNLFYNKPIKTLALIFCFLTFYISCSNEDHVVDCVPRNNVHASYSLNLPSMSILNIPEGYVVIEPDGTNGSRGVILVNTGKEIIAYDRNAPHICPTENSSLIVNEGITLECPEDGAKWLLRTGEPINSQTNGRSPRQFYVNAINDLIQINY